MNSEIRSRLADFDQQHLIQFYDELDRDAQSRLDGQIASVDFGLVETLFQKFGKADTWAELAQRAEPPTALRLDNAANSIRLDDAVASGKKILQDGHVALVLVAGGQGTRLGFAHPKGLYPLSPVRNRTLFQIHIDKLSAINEAFGCVVPLYVMTSPATHQETAEFLEQNEWFGYPREAARIFCQGTMPAVNCETGKVLLSARDRLFASPDGHGGMLAALKKNGCLDEMKASGIKQVFYHQIDNPLSQTCDCATLGYHILAESEMTTQAVPKQHPLQKVGNIVSIDGKVQIIEYSDLPDEVAHRQDLDGSLVFWAGNIAVHVFDVDFLDRMTEHADSLPFHLAHKKVPFVAPDGNIVEPDQPNAIKFERFIFDLLPMARHSIVVEVDPAEAFSPVKNASTESSNTALTAQQAMIDQARRVLASVDVTVTDGAAVELDPALMYDREKLVAATQGKASIDQDTWLQ